MTRWLEGVESAVADRRPLAGSVPLVTQQKEEDEVRCTCRMHSMFPYSASTIPAQLARSRSPTMLGVLHVLVYTYTYCTMYNIQYVLYVLLKSRQIGTYTL